ncbi:MAG: TRAP transporter small permease [Alphaproteobacteria bacterium]|nr:TRAP transporter small permease [Alphaproteobacteria bacterium]MCB9928674.1 TRAP transporter small permease [Alphaproteobacteria bacterium]
MFGLLNAMDRLSQFLGLSVAHFYLVCAIITAYEVVMRYFFDAPTLWAFELVMVVCAIAWVMSGPYVTMRNSHIAITVLYQYTSGTVRWWLDVFIFVVSIAAMAVLAYSLYGPMADAIQVLERSGTSFNSPEPLLLKTVMFAGAALYALQALANLIRHCIGRDRARVELPE